MEGCNKWCSSGISAGTFAVCNIYIYIYIYINDLEENVGGLISKFGDDTKIGGVADR